MGLGVGQLLLILVIILIVFGGGKLPKVMGDVGKGMRNLKDGLKGDEETQDTKDTVAQIVKDEKNDVLSSDTTKVDEKDSTKG